VTKLLFLCALCFVASCTRPQEQGVLPKLAVSVVVPCGAPSAGEPLDFRGQNQKFCLDRSPILTEADVRSASIEKGMRGTAFVKLLLREQASERLREATAKHVGERIGIVLKGKPFSAPTVQEPVSDLPLANAFTEAQAKELAREIQFWESGVEPAAPASVPFLE